MDRLIAAGTVTADAADTAPASGTPGYATDGNPATNTPATQWPAYQYHAIQEELLSVILGSSQTPDRSKNNQLLMAIPLIVPTTPASQLSSLIYAQDRQQFLQWLTIGDFTGYASPLVGLFHWGTTTTPRPFEELLIGSTIDGTLAKYKALVAWFVAQGLSVDAADWVAGEYYLGDNGDGTYILPDLRNQFIRATGTDADTANARNIGTAQNATSMSQYANGLASSKISTPIQNPDGSLSVSISGGNRYSAASQVSQTTESFYLFRPQNTAFVPMICL